MITVIRLTYRNINRLVILAALAAPIVYLFGGLIAGLVGAHGEDVFAEPASSSTVYGGMSYTDDADNYHHRAVYGGTLYLPYSSFTYYIGLQHNDWYSRGYDVSDPTPAFVDGFVFNDTLDRTNSFYMDLVYGHFTLKKPTASSSFADSSFLTWVQYDPSDLSVYTGYLWLPYANALCKLFDNSGVWSLDVTNVSNVYMDTGNAMALDFNPTIGKYPNLGAWRSFVPSFYSQSAYDAVLQVPFFNEPINGLSGSYVSDVFGQFFTHDNWLAQVGRSASAGETPAYGFAPIGTFINYMDANLLHFYANDVGWGMLCYGYFYYAAHVMLLDLAFYMVTFIVRIIKAVVEKMDGGLGV